MCTKQNKIHLRTLIFYHISFQRILFFVPYTCSSQSCQYAINSGTFVESLQPRTDMLSDFVDMLSGFVDVVRVLFD